jgi:hypothetical protein
LLIAGGLALPALPLLQGLMVATLLHTVAWSLAWANALQQGGTRRPAAAATATPQSSALVAAGGVSMLGTAMATLGPQALWLVHAALAILALLWTIARVWHLTGVAARR